MNKIKSNWNRLRLFTNSHPFLTILFIGIIYIAEAKLFYILVLSHIESKFIFNKIHLIHYILSVITFVILLSFFLSLLT